LQIDDGSKSKSKGRLYREKKKSKKEKRKLAPPDSEFENLKG
jgi:hypothetical protein